MKPKNGIRSLKVKQVMESLQNMLLPLSYGDRLPGIRSIMNCTGAGRLTVTHALQILKKEGVIRIDPCRGIFRIKPTEKSDEIRLIHWSLNHLDNIGFVSVLFRSLVHLAAENGRKIVIENVKKYTREQIVEELIRHGISNCFIFGSMNPRIAEYLRKRVRICLELLPRHTERITMELRDSPDMTVIQLHYLFTLGYRRIGYMHLCGNDMYQYPVQVHRLMDYYRLMAENGLRVNPDWVFYCSDHYENLESGMERMMASDPKPEVLIVPGAALKYLYSYCRKNKIRIGKELAVFSQDEINADLSPEPTTITNNPENIAETFWEMFQAAERGEKVESRYTELFIRTGQTLPSRSFNSARK